MILIFKKPIVAKVPIKAWNIVIIPVGFDVTKAIAIYNSNCKGEKIPCNLS